MAGEDEITLKDIENMIKILQKFLRLARKAERLLSQYASRSSYDAVVRALLGMKEANVEAEEVELSKEELETLKKVRELDKKKKV